MSSSAADQEIKHISSDIDWQMLDKSKFFFLGATLFSGVSAALYPVAVLKTRQQVMSTAIPCLKMAASIFRNQGCKGFYAGFGTSLIGTIPARALYMSALEVTKSNVANVATGGLGLSEASASAAANAAAGLSAAMAAQLVWTPVDVISQRLMVQKYNSGIDAFRKIVCVDGVRGLYRGFGVSILTYAPCNALWWASYSIARRGIWAYNDCGPNIAVQGLSAAVASGVAALLTMPLDTVKTRLQVLDGEGREPGRSGKVVETVRSLVKEGGIGACYRGLGPRWASMSMSATMMVTSYEFVKRVSAKDLESYA